VNLDRIILRGEELNCQFQRWVPTRAKTRACSPIAALVLVAFGSSACGGAGNGASKPTEMSGSWTITNNIQSVSLGNFNSTLNVSVVSSVCYTPRGYPTPSGGYTLAMIVNGPGCFMADSGSGSGSITSTGNVFYPPQTLLIGVPSDPIPADTTDDLQLVFVEAGPNNQYAIFQGSGKVSNGRMTGTWSCDLYAGTPSGSPICSDASGTFSGTHQ
jgi:hypothetical protein